MSTLFNKISLKETLTYQLELVNLGYLKFICDVKFNSNYQITNINMKAYHTEVPDTPLWSAESSFKDYGSTQVEVGEDKFDFTNVRCEATLDSSKTKYVATSKQNKKDTAYIFNMPADLSINNLNTINFVNGYTYNNFLDVVLNDKILELNTDYTVEESSEVPEETHYNKIVLKKPLTKNDKLTIACRSSKADTSLELVAA